MDNKEERYINRSILYSVFIADVLEISLSKSNFVSIFKGKNYKIVNSLKERFITYKFLENKSSRDIEGYINRLIMSGYLVEKVNEEKQMNYLHTTKKGREKVFEIIRESNVFKNTSEIRLIPSEPEANLHRDRPDQNEQRHGQAWTSSEEKELILAFKAGKSIPEIALLHGRTDGAIKSRLQKLDLIEWK